MKSNKGFFMCVNNFHNNTTTDITLNNESSLLSNPSENFKLLVNQFNNTSPEYNTDPENIVQSKCYGSAVLQSMKIPNKDKSLTYFI